LQVRRFDELSVTLALKGHDRRDDAVASMLAPMTSANAKLIQLGGSPGSPLA
jgi:hypothetical protein